MARGEADFGLNFIGSQEPDIEFRPLLEERFVAACRRDHPLAKKRRISWPELAAYDFIAVAKTSGNRLLIRRAGRSLSPAAQQLYDFFAEARPKGRRQSATGTLPSTTSS